MKKDPYEPKNQLLTKKYEQVYNTLKILQLSLNVQVI